MFRLPLNHVTSTCVHLLELLASIHPWLIRRSHLRDSSSSHSRLSPFDWQAGQMLRWKQVTWSTEPIWSKFCSIHAWHPRRGPLASALSESRKKIQRFKNKHVLHVCMGKHQAESHKQPGETYDSPEKHKQSNVSFWATSRSVNVTWANAHLLTEKDRRLDPGLSITAPEEMWNG